MNPILSIAKLAETEADPFRKLHRNKDLGEVLVKLATFLLIQVRTKESGATMEMKATLVERLKAPALGVWQEIANIVIKQKGIGDWFLNPFTEYWKTENARTTDIAKLRNELSHAGSHDLPTIQSYTEKLHALIGPMQSNAFWSLFDFSWKEVSEKEAKGYHSLVLTMNGKEVNLSPFFMKKGDDVYVFNGYDPDYSPTYVCYSKESKMVKVSELKETFLDELPMKEWQNAPGTQFLQRMPHWMTGFIGRENFVKQAKDEIKSMSNSIYQFQGKTGSGKTALFSKLATEISNEKWKIVEFFFEEKRTTNNFTFFQEHFLDRTEEYIGKREQAQDFTSELKQTIQKITAKGQVCLFLWDSIEHAPKEVRQLIPVILEAKALILCSSIPYAGSEQFLPAGNTKLFLIPDLNEKETKTISQSILGKKEISDRLYNKMSEGAGGNPRILKLWASSIKAGRRGLGKIPLEQMPGEVQNYFEGLFKDLRPKSNDMDLTMNILFSLAEGTIRSKTSLAELLKVSPEAVEDHLDLLRDLVIPKEEGLTLFLPIFAEFLKLKFPSHYLLNLKEVGMDPKPERNRIKKALVKF